MPGMSGLELINLVSKQFPKLPVVILSGEGDFKDVVSAINASVSYFFTKPIRDLEELDRVMKEAVKQYKVTQESTENKYRKVEKPRKIFKIKPSEKRGYSKNETYYRTLLENGTDAIVLIDSENRISDLNQNAARLFGLTRSELLGKYIDAENFRTELRLFLHSIREMSRQGGEVRFESEICRADKSTRQVEVLSISTLNAELPEQVVYIRDISDFHRSLQTLKTRNDQLLATLGARGEAIRLNSGTLNSFLETANAFVLIIDRQSSILEWNPAAERISGTPRHEALLPGFIKRLFINFEQQLFPLLEIEVFHNGNFLDNLESAIISNDGATKIIKWNISPIKEIGRVEGAMLVGVDVTMEHRLRKELES